MRIMPEQSAPLREVVMNDPVTSSRRRVRAPSAPALEDSMLPSRRQLARSRTGSRSSNHEGFAQNPRMFYKRKGALECYVEHATSNSDLLVWQQAQDRDEASRATLNRLKTSPVTDFYDVRPGSDQSVANTSSHFTTSPLMTHRYKDGLAYRRGRQFRQPGGRAGRQTD